jgi:hypothetical protein
MQRSWVGSPPRFRSGLSRTGAEPDSADTSPIASVVVAATGGGRDRSVLDKWTLTAYIGYALTFSS